MPSGTLFSPLRRRGPLADPGLRGAHPRASTTTRWSAPPASWCWSRGRSASSCCRAWPPPGRSAVGLVGGRAGLGRRGRRPRPPARPPLALGAVAATGGGCGPGLQGRRRPVHPDRAGPGPRQAHLLLLRGLLPRRLLGAAARDRGAVGPDRADAGPGHPVGVAATLAAAWTWAGRACARSRVSDPDAGRGPVGPPVAPSRLDRADGPRRRPIPRPSPPALLEAERAVVLTGLRLGRPESLDLTHAHGEWAQRASLEAFLTEPGALLGVLLPHRPDDRRPRARARPTTPWPASSGPGVVCGPHHPVGRPPAPRAPAASTRSRSTAPSSPPRCERCGERYGLPEVGRAGGGRRRRGAALHHRPAAATRCGPRAPSGASRCRGAAVERAWELAAEADAFVVLDSDLRTAPISLLPSVPLTRGRAAGPGRRDPHPVRPLRRTWSSAAPSRRSSSRPRVGRPDRAPAAVSGPAALFRLDGQAAIVTGASSGLGAIMARALAGAGCAVRAGRPARGSRSSALAAEIAAGGGRAAGPSRPTCATPATPRTWWAPPGEAFGRLDGVVLNAGVSTLAPGRGRGPGRLRRRAARST